MSENLHLTFYGFEDEWYSHLTVNQEIAGSIPVGAASNLDRQGERETGKRFSPRRTKVMLSTKIQTTTPLV